MDCWPLSVLWQAQNIKNFKSQRWQTLLNFHSQRRLLLTGTPLQNSLMELWSLMHFLMPHVFQSHRDFKEWFANPVTGMIEGSREYNESLVRRLHKVLTLLTYILGWDVTPSVSAEWLREVLNSVSSHFIKLLQLHVLTVVLSTGWSTFKEDLVDRGVDWNSVWAVATNRSRWRTLAAHCPVKDRRI